MISTRHQPSAQYRGGGQHSAVACPMSSRPQEPVFVAGSRTTSDPIVPQFHPVVASTLPIGDDDVLMQYTAAVPPTPPLGCSLIAPPIQGALEALMILSSTSGEDLRAAIQLCPTHHYTSLSPGDDSPPPIQVRNYLVANGTRAALPIGHAPGHARPAYCGVAAPNSGSLGYLGRFV